MKVKTMANKPHCYGKMDWILKHDEDKIPKESICSCNYTNSCLRITNCKRVVNADGTK
jgi:hypothetical protein